MNLRKCIPLLIALLAGGPDRAPADHPLRYQLPVGRHLVYHATELTLPLDANDVRAARYERINVWCLARESAELLVLVDSIGMVGGRTEPVVGAVLCLDEHTGRRRWPFETATRFGTFDAVLDVLPPLPLLVQYADAWLTPADPYGRQWRCTGRGPDPAHAGDWAVRVVMEDATGISAALGLTRTGEFWFDPDRGVVSAVRCEVRDTTRGSRILRTAALQGMYDDNAAWAAKRTFEADRFLSTLRHEDRVLHDVASRLGDLPGYLAQLDKLWGGLRNDLDARSG